MSRKRAAEPAESQADSPLRIYVKRGALRRYDRLKRESSNLPVKIEWDRRTTDRRADAEAAAPDEAPAERRGAGKDRRALPPFTWETAEFVVVQGSPEGEDPSEK